MEVQEIKGLSSDEVLANREQFGPNSTTAVEKNKFLQLVKDIVLEPMFVILIVAAVIYLILGEYQEGIIMLLAIAFVSGISVFQENRSRNAVESLKKLANPLAKVIRDGGTTTVNSEEIVMNDVIVVEDGDIIPADAQVLDQHDFSVNESILTGEAMPVTKDLGTDNDKLFQGTMVMTGSCTARVTAVGKLSELGKVSGSLQKIEVPKTPLQLQIRSFVRVMISMGAVAFVVVWAINWYLSRSILHGLMHGLTLAMSVIPEEIPVAFSTFMALGAYHLYKQKVLARSPYTVETLGAATVICVDKTGTITENDMRLSAIYDFKEDVVYDYTMDPFNFNPVLEFGMWSSEIVPFDPMEKSIHEVYASVAEVDQRPKHFMVHEYPLGGTPPIMTHVFSDKKESHIIAVKGSVEGVLRQCTLSTEQLALVHTKNKEFTSKGYRVLAVAQSKQGINNLPASQLDFKFDLKGLLAFYDPPKQNMHQTLEHFYAAGIQVKMITGDHPATAEAIAKQINLNNNEEMLTGEQLMKLDEAELSEKVKTVNIYARMFPDAKLRVIQALKANGEVVAMTGDGVNDGPALKAAHIGVAMGKRGSELAKQAASLILMDDDLTHMVDAVALGRRIYENLKKAIQYIISIHIPIILIVTVPLLTFWKFTDFFSPIHVIFLELIMGPTCSIIFENEPIEADSMTKKPRKMTTSFFSLRELSVSMVQGLVIAAACLGLGYYFIATQHTEIEVRTVIYTTLIFSNLFLTLVNRSFHYSIFTTIRYRNFLLPTVVVASLVVLFLSLYVAPVRNVFQFQALSVMHLLWCLGAAFVGVMWVEIYKAIKRKMTKV